MIIRELIFNDYEDYINLMTQFTNYEYNISFNDFVDRYNKNKDHIKIFVIIENEKIVGAGSIFKLEKLHNNPIGQIEDIIINEKFRGSGYGKKIVQHLIEYGINELKCYKIVLNSLEKNIIFYEKLGFVKCGNQFKYNFS